MHKEQHYNALCSMVYLETFSNIAVVFTFLLDAGKVFDCKQKTFLMILLIGCLPVFL